MATTPTVTLKLNMKTFGQALKKLQGAAPKAIARALNRSASTARTFMARTVAQDMGIKVGSPTTHRREPHSAHEAMYVRAATPDTLSASVVSQDGPMPLVEFKAKGPEPSYGKGKGVKAKLRGGAGTYPHAFLATMKSGHRGVFARAPTVGRLGIYELHGPSVTKVFSKHHSAGRKAGADALVKNLEHEFKRALDQASTGGK